MRFRRIVLILLSGALLLSGPVSAGEANELVLEIPDKVIITGPKITLADLARTAKKEDIQYLEEIGLGMAPAPGRNRILTREYLEFLLQQYQNQRSIRLRMGEKVEVRVKAFHLKRSELAAAIEKLLPPKPSGVIRQWVEYRNLPEELWLTQGDWKVEAAANGKVPELGRALFKLKLSNGATIKEMNIAAVIKKTAWAYRVLRNIPVHTVLNPADFEKLEVTLVNGKEYVGDFPESYRNSRVLRRGQILASGSIQPVPLIQKGMTVTVVARGNGVEITLSGVAKKDGWLEDRIVLVNPVSKKEFKGQVIGKNCVEVAIK
jgi:flagella basal body P-ring formation protein FlgA